MTDDLTSDVTSDSGVLALRLHAVAIHLLRRLRREDAALGVGPARLSALSVVGFGGPRTLGELAAAEEVTPPTMTRIVSGLEEAGLVRRVAVPGDKRAVRIEATEAGLRVLHEGRARRAARLDARLRALSPADRAALERAASLLEGMLNDGL